ncbi:hypothetical protein O6H91_19G001100 [Diphasiastrum complanatum]|uniref:Uncharacterized protein n=1 Tax=Diphasiastrum complanatum TaxID=34168 RepID=A0ACC2AS88_DIPCM|nr:hypothetical protein O6H91_19G001100 [Diphasiastrum complanatum]
MDRARTGAVFKEENGDSPSARHYALEMGTFLETQSIMQEETMGACGIERPKEFAGMRYSVSEEGAGSNRVDREDPKQVELNSFLERSGNWKNKIKYCSSELDEDRLGVTEFLESFITERYAMPSIASTFPPLEDFVDCSSKLSKAVDIYEKAQCVEHQSVEARDSSQFKLSASAAEPIAMSEEKLHSTSEIGSQTQVDQTRFDTTQSSKLISFERQDILTRSPSSQQARFGSYKCRDDATQNCTKVANSSAVHILELQRAEIEPDVSGSASYNPISLCCNLIGGAATEVTIRRACNSSKSCSFNCSDSPLVQQKTGKGPSKQFSGSRQPGKGAEIGFEHQSKGKLDYKGNTHTEGMLFEVCAKVSKAMNASAENFYKKPLTTEVAQTEFQDGSQGIHPKEMQFIKENAGYDSSRDQATDAQKYVALYVLAEAAVEVAYEQENTGIRQLKCAGTKMHNRNLKEKAVFLGGSAPRTTICTPSMSRRDVYMHVGESMQVSVQQMTCSRSVSSSSRLRNCGSKVREKVKQYKAIFIHGSIPFTQRQSTRHSRGQLSRIEKSKLDVDGPRTNVQIQQLSSDWDEGCKHVGTVPTAHCLLSEKLKCTPSLSGHSKPKRLGDFTLEAPKKRQRKPSVRLSDI